MTVTRTLGEWASRMLAVTLASGAVTTQYLGSSMRGSCTIDTIASISVSVSYSVGGHRLGGGKATASFPCVEIAL